MAAYLRQDAVGATEARNGLDERRIEVVGHDAIMAHLGQAGYRDLVDEQGRTAELGARPQPAARLGPRLPWTGRPRKADIACWVGITLAGAYYWVVLPFRASLVGTHPVLLEVLSGSTESVVAGAAFARVGQGTLLVVLLATIPGLMKFDPIYWSAGRLWGERIIMLLPGFRRRGPRYMAWVERWGRKFSWPAVLIGRFVPIPNAIICVAAGWAGMRLVTFLILDLIGTLMWAAMLAGLGYALGHHAVVVAQTISHYGLWISLALIAVFLVAQVRSQRRAAHAARRIEGDEAAG